MEKALFADFINLLQSFVAQFRAIFSRIQFHLAVIVRLHARLCACSRMFSGTNAFTGEDCEVFAQFLPVNC